jgi:phosphopantetheine adenylyltransferase
MAAMNRAMSAIPTVFMPADPASQWVSSSQVRALVGLGMIDSARQMVPSVVAAALTDRHPER